MMVVSVFRKVFFRYVDQRQGGHKAKHWQELPSSVTLGSSLGGLAWSKHNNLSQVKDKETVHEN